MNMKQVTLATAASLALCVTAYAGGHNAPAYSHSGYNSDWATGWYLGAGVNGDAAMTAQTSFGQSWEGTTGATEIDLEKSENNIGWSVYLGRKVSHHFAFELGYDWIGNQHFKATTGTEANHGNTDKAEVKQWNVHGVGLIHFPIGEYFNVFGKGGVAYYQNHTDFDTYYNTAAGTSNAKLDTFALTYGAGVELTVDQFGIRGEYTVIEPNFNNQTTFYISDVVGASIFYRFM